MDNIILWVRLKEICEGIILTMRNERVVVELHASTDMPDDMMAAVTREGARVDIALNVLFNKTVDDIIGNLGHELVHIIDNSDDHPDDFESKAGVVRRTIERNYIR